MGKVLIACEFSGTVRDAFLAAGHDAWSCDIIGDESGAGHGSNRHLQGDVRDILAWEEWDLLMVAHPPCTRLCNSGVRWLHKAPPGRTLDDMWRELDEGAALFSDLWTADVPRICVENPVMHREAKARIRDYQEPAQTVQPWQFATDPDSWDNQRKRTCLWLRGLPPLVPTGTLDGKCAGNAVHHAAPGPDRWKVRAKFFPGIARAMAEQWGSLLPDSSRIAA